MKYELSVGLFVFTVENINIVNRFRQLATDIDDLNIL